MRWTTCLTAEGVLRQYLYLCAGKASKVSTFDCLFLGLQLEQ
jgi:hypothetical protein